MSQLRFALQLALLPPFEPEQVHVYGPEPPTALAEPALQSPDDGAASWLVPLADPQAPVITCAHDAPLCPHEPSLQVVVTDPVQPPAPLPSDAE